jgi:uncharacterized phiE125 gp8 family phage protein
MALQLVTPPATEPVTLDEAKLHCKIEVDDDDTLVTALIVAARQAAEHELERALITQTWRKTLDEFPDAIELPRPPILAITSVKYFDADNVQITLSAESYQLDKESEPGWLLPAYGFAWPGTAARANAVEVIYSAGYGAAEAVPQAIKQWMLVMIKTAYDNREALVPGAATPTPFVHCLLDRYRIGGL